MNESFIGGIFETKYRELFNPDKVRVSEHGGGVLIVCEDDQQAQKIVWRADEFSQDASIPASINSFRVVGGSVTYDIPLDLHLKTMNPVLDLPVPAENLLSLPSSEAQAICNSWGRAACIVRMPTPDSPEHLGVFSNDLIQQASGIRPNVWVGKDMKHLPDQLHRLITALWEAARNPENPTARVQYVAPFFDGRLHQFEIEGFVCIYRGDVCRLVKNLSCEPLS